MYKLINACVSFVYKLVKECFTLCVHLSTVSVVGVNIVFDKVVKVVNLSTQKYSLTNHYSTYQNRFFEVLVNSYTHNPQGLLLKRQIRI
jgi:hypothetical protein